MEGAPHTAKKQLMSLEVPPAGGRGKEAGLGGAPSGGKPTWTPSPIRPLPSIGGGKGKEREREKERGAAPPPLCPIRTLHGGRAPPPCGLPCLSPMAHVAHYFPRGVPVTHRYSDKFPKHSRTIPVSEYHQ